MPLHRFLLGFVPVLLLGACAKKETAAVRVSDQVQPVEVTTIVRQDLAETLNLVGSVAANESATIRPETTGLVREIHFEEGQSVRKGQLLVKIDDAELRAQLGQSEARYRLAELDLRRAEMLGQTQSNSIADIDRARSEFASAKSELDLIRVRLERSEIRAPFDGVLGARTLSPGDYVNSQSIITTIDDLSRLKIEFQVPERFTAKVRTGTMFSLGSPALPPGAELTGEVYFVASVVDRATRSSAVKGYVTASVGGLKPGMFANIELVLDVRRGDFYGAGRRRAHDDRGHAVGDDQEVEGQPTADFVPVQLGLRTKGVVEVNPLRGELTERTQVVASGVGALILFQGAKVAPRAQVTDFRTASLQ